MYIPLLQGNPLSSYYVSQHYTFAIERYEKRLRLIAYQNGEEYVCRKADRKQLREFLSADESQAFKGRLQLFKHGNYIAVEVKGEFIGTIDKADMQQCLSGLSLI